MKVFENELYKEDIEYVANLSLSWNKLQDKSIMISGATGLVGSFLIDVIMKKNQDGMNCKVYALGRNRDKAQNRFSYCFDNDNFIFLSYDVNQPIHIENIEKIDYILHLASNTHPMLYATDPIGTITTNIIGTKNMIEFAIAHNASRFAFASSNEVYGENRGDVEFFDEKYCGYIDCNTLRAGYPESKRCGEALCQAYIVQNDLDIVIPRLTRTYGATLLSTDSKALSQFLFKGIHGENIVLKSLGNQYYSYLYVADTVSGLLTVLLEGVKGEAYNIADVASDITLKEVASIVAAKTGNEVIYEIPDKIEKAGYSTATKARLDSKKLQSLGWKAKYNINSGIARTLNILKSSISV